VSERQSYSEALERLHQRHHRSADFGHDGLIALNAEHVVLHANDMAHQLLGYTEGSLVGQSYCQTLCLTPHCSARSGPLLMRAVHRAQRHDQPIECTSDHLLHASRQPISVNIWAVRFIEAINKGVAEVVVFRVRDEMHQTSNDDPQRIGIFTTDRNGTIKAVNPAFTQITGFSSDEAIGHTPALIRSSVHSQDFYKAFWKNLSSKHKWQGELWNRRKNGEVYPQLTVVYAVAGVNGQPLHYIALMQDISTTTKVDETAHLLPYHDALTGLPNRTFFEQTVAKTLDESPNTPFAIGFLDLDNFTGINDGLGHITGDRLLYLIATRLSRQLRDHDLVARWGGDKFALMLWNISGESEIKQVLGRFLGGLAQSFSVAGKEVVPVARVGVACYPQDGRDVDTLMHAADTAQTHAKAKGLGSLCFYNAELAETSRLHFELAHELRIGIRERQLFLMYQPQVDAHTGMVVGLEALVRWNHPVRGMVSPANFIPVAEENNQMEELGAEVLRLACAQIAEWRKDMDFSTPVGINVAPQQLKPGFPELIERMMSEYNIPPSLIEIEITESALKPTTEIRAIVSAIKALGVTLAIDDFGTGYSSLSHLKLFPFDRLKIDKSFVDGLPSSVDDIAIGQAIIALGQALKVNVLAEGVECGEQADFLRGEGVHAIQGYFYSRPLAQSDILPFINRVDVAVSIEM
jgi:diguanylate cyclase (GGDEF)-like protein/PAS domain S-box-containing protein